MRVGQMRPGQRTQIGAARRDDRIHMVGLRDVADGHRGDADLIADAVGKRRLEHPAVDRLGLDRGLPGGYVDQIHARLLERVRDHHRIVHGDAAIHPVGGRDSHRHRLVRWPCSAHGAEHFERIAQSICQTATKFIRAVVGQRRDERRQQIAVRGMQLDHVEPCHFRMTRRADEGVEYASISARVIVRGT